MLRYGVCCLPVYNHRAAGGLHQPIPLNTGPPFNNSVTGRSLLLMINLSKCLIVILVLFSTMVLRRQAVRTDKDRYLIQVKMIKTVFLSQFLLRQCIFLFFKEFDMKI